MAQILTMKGLGKRLPWRIKAPMVQPHNIATINVMTTPYCGQPWLWCPKMMMPHQRMWLKRKNYQSKQPFTKNSRQKSNTIFKKRKQSKMVISNKWRWVRTLLCSRLGSTSTSNFMLNGTSQTLFEGQTNIQLPWSLEVLVYKICNELWPYDVEFQ
jgi:hypothetical protein